MGLVAMPPVLITGALAQAAVLPFTVMLQPHYRTCPAVMPAVRCLPVVSL